MINIVLYQPEIPANTGNIMRTANVTGARLHLIGPLGFSLEEKALKRAGLDYIKTTDYTYYPTYEDFITAHPDIEVFYISRYGKIVYSDIDFSRQRDYWVMFGKESTGIDRHLLKQHFDHTLRIPMQSAARSLNLSNAVAIVVYEVFRQQKYAGLATHEVIKGEDFLLTIED